MKRQLYIVFLLLLSITSVYAQKENNNWFFGHNAALTWNTTQNFSAMGVYGTTNIVLAGIPTSVSGSPLNTYEGCFSTSDADGNLLFFSDGMTIWNKNNLVMTNGSGLTGDPSSVQSGIIFPYPYNLSKYIAVTLGKENANNLSYSIVDMSQSGGLGAVQASFKNILFTGQSGALGETVTAVRHTNRNDFWVVAPGRGATSYLNVWKVTSAGVQTARHSVATVNHGTTPTIAGGNLKFTTDGQHFVWIDFDNAFFAYGDFDPTTGIISNVRIRDAGPTLADAGYGYGVEFSPSGRYLYLTYTPIALNSNSKTGLFVYDFNALLASSTPNSVSPIRSIINPMSLSDGITDHFGAIQAGSDGRLYIVRFASMGMFVITNPEQPALLAIYKLNNILSGIVHWGLPSFAAPWFRIIIDTDIENVCAEIPTDYHFTIENGMGFNNVSRIVLDFGDGGVGSIVTFLTPALGTYTQSYNYKIPGTYTITATAYNSSNGVELVSTTPITISSCVMRVNPHVRGVNK